MDGPYKITNLLLIIFFTLLFFLLSLTLRFLLLPLSRLYRRSLWMIPALWNIVTSFMDGPLQNHEFVAHYLLHVTIFSFVSYLELWIVHILYVSWSVECIWYRSYLWERHWRNDIVNLFPYTLYRLGLANYGQNWQILSKKLLDIFACCLKMFKKPTIFNIVHWVTKQLIDKASDVPSMY